MNATRSQNFGGKAKALPSPGARTGFPKKLLASESWATRVTRSRNAFVVSQVYR